MLSWQRKLIEVVIAFAVLGGAWWYAGYLAVVDYKQAQVAEQAKADKAQQKKYDKLAGDYEALKSKRTLVTNTITREIETIVKQPIYQTQCVDQAGLDIANKALRGDLE